MVYNSKESELVQKKEEETNKKTKEKILLWIFIPTACMHVLG
jgi:hypothetical protein